MASALRGLLGVLVGAGIGFLIYRFVGCRSGMCPLTGNVWIATTLWAVVGLVVATTSRPS